MRLKPTATCGRIIDLSPLAVKLVDQRFRDQHGVFDQIIARIDIPRRTDHGPLPNHRTIPSTVPRRGAATAVGFTFRSRSLTVDHIRHAGERGGSGHFENLSLLCGAWNSLKGSGTHAELLAKLKR